MYLTTKKKAAVLRKHQTTITFTAKKKCFFGYFDANKSNFRIL
jgi:hypothetical protein